MTDWNKRLVDLAKYISSFSKDRSTKVGAVIADDEHRILSLGYNGFPRGCNDDAEDRHQRPLKYKWTEHAERNAIYNACKNGVQTNGATIYLAWFPCCDCARAIVQSGIKRLVCHKPNFNDERWGEDFKIANDILGESGILMEFVEE